MTRFDQISFEVSECQAAGLRRRIHDLEIQQCESDELIADLEDNAVRFEMTLTHLEAALISSRQMAAWQVTEDQAFATLTRISKQQGRHLRLVARDVVHTGTL